MEEISEELIDKPCLFRVDAAQTFGKDVEALKTLECDFLSLSGHKIYGPKGVGALYARRPNGMPSPLAPITFGGGQERGLRAGTLPVPLIVGLGEATAIAKQEFMARKSVALENRDGLLAALSEIEISINGALERIQTHILNITIPGVDSEALMMAISDSFSFSNGSACTSSSYRPSHVLHAMGVTDDETESSVRFSWGGKTVLSNWKSLIDVIGSI
ncbi:MAG TPA: aminotransferase class V-fold PLP-dependent enzyme, partial [Candidatus Melainabacteria bacterium]|nr:aminotransferase class V-fold PLP-dependent enzyme [Candidatus Melainabacteria bacterium]